MDRKTILKSALSAALTSVGGVALPASAAQLPAAPAAPSAPVLATDMQAISHGKSSLPGKYEATVNPIIQDILKGAGTVNEAWVSVAFSKAA
jgi:hypothetical protein